MTKTDEFTHDHKLYNLSKVRLLVRDKKAFLLKTKDLIWILKYDKPDETRVKMAKHRYPLLVTKYKGKWVVIDGIHRLERYRRKNIGVVPVKEVTPEMLKYAFIKQL